MKNRRSLVFALVLLNLIAFGLFYVQLHSRNDNSMVKPRPTPNELNVLLKSIAEHSGDKQAVVNIVNNGKYSLPGENFTFDYKISSTSFVALKKVKNLTQRAANRNKKTQWDGYLRIYQFGEELSKQMRIFLAVTHFPGFENMKIVAPRFRKGIASSVGPTQFDTVYNLDGLNQVFLKNGYPPIVLDKEYNDVCKDSKPIYVVDFRKKRHLDNMDKIDKRLYGNDGKDLRERWIDCDFNKDSFHNFAPNLTNRKIICTTFNFNISSLRQTILKNVTCIEVPTWGDHALHGKGRPDRLTPDEIFNYVLNPSDILVKEAKIFTDEYLERPYVAVHIRANHINRLPSTVNRCFKVAMRIVNMLIKKRDVKSLYLSTDLNEYGAPGAYTPGHEEYLAAISGAVRYNPKIRANLIDVSRTTVSIINMLLLTKSDHLIAIGAGSYHGFVMSQFLRQHFEKDPKTWSLIRMCENARGRGMTRDPSANYSKWES